VKAYYEHAGIAIYNCDCRELLPTLPKVSLVVTDPPYNGVLEEEWDNQWGSDDEFIAWLDGVFVLVKLSLADNGTVYVFSSPRLAARTECMLAERFNVIASAVWDKGDGRNGAAGSGVDVTSLRTYWTSNTERVIVAEQKTNGPYSEADEKAKDACGYWRKCDETKRTIIGEYLRAEFERAGVTNKQIAALFPSKTGGLTGCVSNWLLGFNIPTADQYAKMREFLGGSVYLRREYEDLRRPFFLTAADQWGDVWRFGIERDRIHPAQKPMGLISQMVRVSSRPGDLVLDLFMGSGTTLRAAKELGRKAIGCDTDERCCEQAARRLSQEVLNFGGAT